LPQSGAAVSVLLVSTSYLLVLNLLIGISANMELMLSAFSLACKLPAIACLQVTCNHLRANYLQLSAMAGLQSTCHCQSASYLQLPAIAGLYITWVV
jgi:hypothetical protein